MNLPVVLNTGPVPAAALLLPLLLALLRPVCADELLMKDGSRLLGKVVKKEDGVLQFETGYAGLIKVQWDEVAELHTDEPVRVMLDDETLLEADSIDKSADATRLQSADGAAARSVTPGQVVYINPESYITGEGIKWTGRINLDLEIERGNSDEDEFNMDAETRLRRKNDRITLFGQYEKDKTDGEVTTEKWDLSNKYDYFVSKKLYYGGLLAFKHDRFADLDLRTTVGPHVGYQFFESERLNLDTDIGVLYVHENFDMADNDDFWAFGWLVDFDWFLVPGRVQFYHRHTGRQDVSEAENLVIDSWTGFRFPLFMGLVASTEAEVDYDGGAPAGVDKTETTYRLKLGYQW